jgi:outer membrane receptor for ferrienterochelin and colicins
MLKSLIGHLKIFWIICFLLIVSIINARPVLAVNPDLAIPEDLKGLSLEELMKIEVSTVYGASKFEQNVTEAPSAVSIVTADEIKKYGYRTLADILRSLRSFLITNDRNYYYTGVRGFGRTGDYDRRILIMVDGHHAKENIFGSASIGEDFVLDIDLIDRVEVIRGPSSSLYGNNAFFAVINIITKGEQDLKGVEISGAAGSYGTYKGRLSLGKKFDNDLEMVFSGSLFDSKGQDLFFKEFDSPATNNGIARDSDHEGSYTIFSKLSFGDFSLEGAYVSRKKEIPTASYGTDFNDPRNKTIDKSGYIDLKYEHVFENALKAMARVSYNTYKYAGDYVFTGVINKDLATGEWWNGEVMFSKQFMERHKVAMGAVYQVNTKQNQRNYNEKPYEEFLDDKRDSNEWAFYIQDEFTIMKKLILNAGLRYDQYSTFGGTTNPRLALIYLPFEKTAFKLIYGTAFLTPNVYELFYNSYPNKENPELKSEKIKTYELVFEQYFGNNVHMTVSGFYNRITDLIGQKTDPSDNLLVYQNISKVNAKGLEIEFDGVWENGMRGRISYTIQNTEDDETGKPLVNSPRHLAKFNLIVPVLREKIFSGLEMQYVSERKTLADKNIGAFFVTNVTVFSRKLIRGAEISGSIYNLFDKKFSDPGAGEHLQDAIQQDGRSFRCKLTLNF